MSENSIKSLNGLRILVTRPKRQAQTLCRLIEQAGGVPLCFPVLEILPSRKMPDTARLFQRLDNFHWIIFISANAVSFAANLFARPLPETLRVAAIGQATSKALAEWSIKVDLTPKPPFNAEALLASPKMQQMKDQRCLIVRGEGGRELLAETLKARGAKVSYAEVYRRGKPDADGAALIEDCQRQGLDVITITSREALHNLLAMLDSGYHRWVKQIPLVAISGRIQQEAFRLGFNRVWVAESASDQALLEALKALAEKS